MAMKVFKFGGASQVDSFAIRHVSEIIRAEFEPLVVVVSAIGTTTDELEAVHRARLAGEDLRPHIMPVMAKHEDLVKQLIPKPDATLAQLKTLIGQIDTLSPALEEDEAYDAIVSLGELISSLIMAHLLKVLGIASEWKDAREVVITDRTFREARILWDETRARLAPWQHLKPGQKIITQGFIGGTRDGATTTLGREGSDFTAAILAASLGAESVTIWKDVPGVMNADPKKINTAIVFDELPYQEAAEMTYYGASVIHPKTIKPLANSNIPLWVKSFKDPRLPGTRIHKCKVHHLPPLIVLKENQCLISCKVVDYTFISEENLQGIFAHIAQSGVRINVMQNSAISFSFCVDYRENRVLALIDRLSAQFEVYYNTGLTLITIKNYDAATAQHYRSLHPILLEQSSRSTLQVLVRL